MDEQHQKTTEGNPPTGGESWGDLLRFTVIIIALVIPFRIFIAQPYIVEGSSMDPTFKDGDYLIVDQISYRFEHPERGDVIIMKYPGDTSKSFIKRVIGLPEDTISIKNGKVFVTSKNGNIIEMDDSYVKFPKQDNFNVVLKTQEYFVLGDNRAGSSDSRYWGPLPEEDIVGRPLLRLLPFSKVSLFPGKQD